MYNNKINNRECLEPTYSLDYSEYTGTNIIMIKSKYKVIGGQVEPSTYSSNYSEYAYEHNKLEEQ